MTVLHHFSKPSPHPQYPFPAFIHPSDGWVRETTEGKFLLPWDGYDRSRFHFFAKMPVVWDLVGLGETDDYDFFVIDDIRWGGGNHWYLLSKYDHPI